MARKLLACVSAHQLTAAEWGGRLGPCQVFPNTEPGWLGFQRWLARAPSAPVRLLADVVEEDYRLESLPHSFGKDRRELVARRLLQYFRNTPLRAARFQGKQAGARQDDRFLFAALTHPETFSHWLAAIEKAGNPLAGVFPAPLAGEALAAKLAPGEPHLLLISKHASGLRQSYFRDGRFRISRLSRTENPAQGGLDLYTEEITSTRLYLTSLRLIPPGEQPLVLIVDADGSLEALGPRLIQRRPELRWRRCAPGELAQSLGISAKALAANPDALHLHLLGSGRGKALQLAGPELTHRHRAYLFKRGLYGASLAVLLAAGAVSAFHAYRQWSWEAEARELRQQTLREQDNYRAVTAQFPAAPASAEALKQAVDAARRLRDDARTPDAFMAALSRALDNSPEVTVRRLRWSRDGKTGEMAEAVAKLGDGPSTGLRTGLAGENWDGVQYGWVEAEIRPFRGDFRAALSSINGFVERLAKDPVIRQAKVAQLPLDISSDASLSGNTRDIAGTSSGANFKVAVLLAGAK